MYLKVEHRGADGAVLHSDMARRHVLDLNPFSMKRLHCSARVSNEKRPCLSVARLMLASRTFTAAVKNEPLGTLCISHSRNSSRPFRVRRSRLVIASARARMRTLGFQ
jgi:hypothetical protein